MELAIPGMIASVVVTRPIDRAAEPVEQSPPGGLPLCAGMVGMAVDPVLEGVDGGDPRQDQYDSLEQLTVGPAGFRGLVKRVEPARAQKLHRHRGDLAKLEGAFAVCRQRLAAARQRVKCMPSLVQ